MNLKFTTVFTHKLSLAICLIVLPVFFFATTSSFAESNQKKQNQLQKKISSASASLKNSRAVSSQLKKHVRMAEEKLNVASRELFKTEEEVKRLTKKLKKLTKKKAQLITSTEAQKKALAQQLQALYTSGKQSHLRLLLKQDDPSDISRTTKYFEYLNKHRLKRINAINKKLKAVKQLEAQINTDTRRLKDLQKKQKAKKLLLKSAVAEKERALKKQRRKVLSKERQLAKLVKEENRLRGVIESLARKQEKEARERKAARKKLKLAAAKSTKSAKEKKTRKGKSISSAKRTSQRTVKARKKTTNKKLQQVKTHYVPNKPFSSLRGKLSWPVRGSLLHRYGSVRNSKQRWKAVVISAPGGTRVRAVARGKVEYSGRLKGYGYVIIIRHDRNYRSIYGYNRSVYKREGQIVRAGEVIAAVGNSGGLSKTGLYFEIRRGTTHQNPARWCR